MSNSFEPAVDAGAGLDQQRVAQQHVEQRGRPGAPPKSCAGARRRCGHWPRASRCSSCLAPRRRARSSRSPRTAGRRSARSARSASDGADRSAGTAAGYGFACRRPLHRGSRGRRASSPRRNPRTPRRTRRHSVAAGLKPCEIREVVVGRRDALEIVRWRRLQRQTASRSALPFGARPSRASCRQPSRPECRALAMSPSTAMIERRRGPARRVRAAAGPGEHDAVRLVADAHGGERSAAGDRADEERRAASSSVASPATSPIIVRRK